MTVHKRWLIPFTEELVTWRQYVFIALMIVLILIMGVGDSEARELIYPASVATLVVVMEVIGFALLALGLVVQLTRFELGLGLVGLGLFCSSFAVFPIQFVAYPIVCYQTAVAAARLNFRRRLWLTIIIVGSLYASAYILIVPELFQGKSRLHWWQTLHLYNVILIIGAVIVGVLVTIGFFWLVGSGIRRRYQRMQDLEARADYAVVQERNRIAREMHDIIAHSLTVMIAQAGSSPVKRTRTWRSQPSIPLGMWAGPPWLKCVNSSACCGKPKPRNAVLPPPPVWLVSVILLKRPGAPGRRWTTR